MQNWLDREVSLYLNVLDRTGQRVTLREVIFSKFAKDLSAIISLRKLDGSATDYQNQKTLIKQTLECYTPAAWMDTRAAGKSQEIVRTSLMQLDFDYISISEYDIEEVKQAIFALPFVAFCGLSCSGDGFYTLIEISDPKRLAEYAEHCFTIFTELGVTPDTTKGRNPQDLRFISYDSNMLIREHPEPLRITKFRKKPITNRIPAYAGVFNPSGGNDYLKKALAEIQSVQVGQRWGIVQKVAFTLGGYGQPEFLTAIIQAINTTPAFSGEETNYIKCANDCFRDGAIKPLKMQAHE